MPVIRTLTKNEVLSAIDELRRIVNDETKDDEVFESDFIDELVRDCKSFLIAYKTFDSKNMATEISNLTLSVFLVKAAAMQIANET